MEPVCTASEVRASSVSFSATESRDQVMSNSYSAAPSAPDGCLGDGGAFSAVLEGQVHLGFFQVCVNALAVGVRAVVADEVGGVADDGVHRRLRSWAIRRG